ncbi:hypothetical protein E6O75_ATG07696 [Venturia nashicola]|uniref:Uncharacterized protein n=1 Tax=Venturia nashicola TaxID=86259 RepID=A0A4Z1PEE0_9PEZI|nr:hypothetical protein E6O75_ATG07696 [Venturia nashicola]
MHLRLSSLRQGLKLLALCKEELVATAQPPLQMALLSHIVLSISSISLHLFLLEPCPTSGFIQFVDAVANFRYMKVPGLGEGLAQSLEGKLEVFQVIDQTVRVFATLPWFTTLVYAPAICRTARWMAPIS